MGCGASQTPVKSDATNPTAAAPDPATQPATGGGSALSSMAESIAHMRGRMSEDEPPYKGATAKAAYAGLPLMQKPKLDVGVWTCDVCAWDETDYAVDEVTLMLTDYAH